MHWIPMFEIFFMPDKWHRQNHFILFLVAASSLRKLPEHIRMVCYNQSRFSLLFSRSCNIPHHLITYFIISLQIYHLPINMQLLFHYFSNFLRFDSLHSAFTFSSLFLPSVSIVPHEFHPAAVPPAVLQAFEIPNAM